MHSGGIGSGRGLVRSDTYLIRAYSLNPSANGIGLNVPIQPLNLGSAFGLAGLIVFQVTNIALS